MLSNPGHDAVDRARASVQTEIEGEREGVRVARFLQHQKGIEGGGEGIVVDQDAGVDRALDPATTIVRDPPPVSVTAPPPGKIEISAAYPEKVVGTVVLSAGAGIVEVAPLAGRIVGAAPPARPSVNLLAAMSLCAPMRRNSSNRRRR